jgi:hypothetical protein
MVARNGSNNLKISSSRPSERAGPRDSGKRANLAGDKREGKREKNRSFLPPGSYVINYDQFDL